jgi:hypothetical protein
MNTAVVVIIVLVLLVAVVLGVVASRRKRSAQLREHFGPEYERTVSTTSGDRRAAEAELTERRHRREEFDIRDLPPEERGRFRQSWNEIQRGFVDDPRGSLQGADLLVAEIMRARGYPVDDDFDRRADDLSVDHPRVVQHYREARQVRDADGDVDTERQRKAVTSYRSLVDALLGEDDAHHTADGADGAAADHRGRDVDTDPGATGRHAAHEPEPRDRAARPTDPDQNPRTEEHTR